MTWISNNWLVASYIVSGIKGASEGLELKEESQCGGYNVPVETDCTSSYGEGVKLSKAFQQHLLNSSQLVQTVSDKLQEANQQAVKINSQNLLGGGRLPWNQE